MLTVLKENKHQRFVIVTHHSVVDRHVLRAYDQHKNIIMAFYNLFIMFDQLLYKLKNLSRKFHVWLFSGHFDEFKMNSVYTYVAFKSFFFFKNSGLWFSHESQRNFPYKDYHFTWTNKKKIVAAVTINSGNAILTIKNSFFTVIILSN